MARKREVVVLLAALLCVQLGVGARLGLNSHQQKDFDNGHGQLAPNTVEDCEEEDDLSFDKISSAPSSGPESPLAQLQDDFASAMHSSRENDYSQMKALEDSQSGSLILVNAGALPVKPFKRTPVRQPRKGKRKCKKKSVKKIDSKVHVDVRGLPEHFLNPAGANMISLLFDDAHSQQPWTLR